MHRNKISSSSCALICQVEKSSHSQLYILRLLQSIVFLVGQKIVPFAKCERLRGVNVRVNPTKDQRPKTCQQTAFIWIFKSQPDLWPLGHLSGEHRPHSLLQLFSKRNTPKRSSYYYYFKYLHLRVPNQSKHDSRFSLLLSHWSRTRQQCQLQVRFVHRWHQAPSHPVLVTFFLYRTQEYSLCGPDDRRFSRTFLQPMDCINPHEELRRRALQVPWGVWCVPPGWFPFLFERPGH